MLKLQPSLKNHPLFRSKPPVKMEILSSAPLFEILVEVSTP